MATRPIDAGVSRRATPVVPGRVIYRAARIRGSSYRVTLPPAKPKR